MKFSEKWLREWTDPAIDSVALAHQLTMAGHEVESVSVHGDGLDGVTIGEVLSVEKHPNADRLRLCRVSRGAGETVELVCGAPNVVAGMKSPLAVPGVTLPNGVKLRKSKIRGVVSHGMLCSAVELGLGSESDGIVELPADAPVGEALSGYLDLPDNVIDVNLTPNRGDCFSVIGIARDLAAMTGAAFAEPASVAAPVTIADQQPVELADPGACPRFAGRVIRNIDPAARSPLWMVERLRRSDIRSIHPVVDVTNYVMLELGQPLHAYDLAAVQGAIRPRFARQGESVTLLDERTVTLAQDTVVIVDDSGPIGLAGIMGGRSTAVEMTTTDVFLEAAFWPPAVMAGRARAYATHTDASMRFERGVDPEGQARAIDRATELLLQISGGAAGPMTDVIHSDYLPARSSVRLRRDRLGKVLGADIDSDTVTGILRRLGFSVDSRPDGWLVESPSYRFDVAIEEDLIEEVARIYGYDNIPEATAIAATPLVAADASQVDIDLVAEALVARDYQEAITYSFVGAAADAQLVGRQSELVLANPISSEMSVMRSTLWSGLLQAAAANLSRQQERVRLFEIGKSFAGTLAEPEETLRVAGLVTGMAAPEQWGDEGKAVDFFDIKSDVETLIALSGAQRDFTFVASGHAALQPGQSAAVIRNSSPVGMVGKVHPRIARTFDIRKDVFVFELDARRVFETRAVRARAVSKYPAIRRDLAILVRDSVAASDLVSAVESADPAFVGNVVIFDIYRGPGIEAGLKSVALGLILQETSRTLTDEDADSAMAAAVRKLQHEFAAVLRD